MLYTDEQLALETSGLTVKDLWVSMQLLDKAAGSGVIAPTEFTVMSEWRAAISSAIEGATGEAYDATVAKAQEKAMEEAKAKEAEALEAAKAQQEG